MSADRQDTSLFKARAIEWATLVFPTPNIVIEQSFSLIFFTLLYSLVFFALLLTWRSNKAENLPLN